MTIEMKVPVLPELIDTAKIATLYVAEGHQVAKDQVLCDIETSKVVLELRAPEASRIGKIVVNEGDVLKADALIMSITPDPELNHLVALESKRVQLMLSNEDITTEHELKGKGNIDVQIDALPEFVDSATIIEIYVKEGDMVACGDRLCDVYTDKVILEVCAPNDGVVCDFIKKLEQAVVAGETIVTLYHPEYIAPETTLPESKEDNIDVLIAQVLLDPALDNEPSTQVELNRPSHQATCDSLEAHKEIAAVEATDSTVIDAQLKNESPPFSTQTGDSYVDLTNDHVGPASTVLRSESAVISKRVQLMLSNEDITTEHELKGKGNIDVQIDALPDFVESATVIEIYVKEGDMVACGDRLCDVYTDKAILEVCAPNDGVVCDFIKKLEQAVVAGETIVTLYHPEYIAPETTLPESKEDNTDALIAQVLLDPALDNEPSTLVELNRPSHQATCDSLEAHKDIAAVEAIDSTVIDAQLKNESPPFSTQTGDSYVDLTNDHVSPASTVLRSESAVIAHVREDCSKDSQEGGASSGKVFTFAASVIVIALAGYFLLV